LAFVCKQGSEFVHELRHVLELSIDRGEAHVCDLVDPVKMAHHGFADHSTRDFGLPELLHSFLDPVRDVFEDRNRNRALFTSLLEPLQNFGAIKRLPSTVFLDHDRQDFLDALVGGVSPAATEAFAPTANQKPVAVHAGVHDLVLLLAAERTPH
jgi:hypothetical protein